MEAQNDMAISEVQLFIMMLTVALVIGCGIWSAKSVHSAEGYSLDGRNAGAGLVAGSIAGTCVGGGATVGTAQLASVIGMSAWWFTLGVGISLILMAMFYAKSLRRTSLETISQYLVLNYEDKAGTFVGVVSSVGIFFSAVASTLPGIGILSFIFNISSGEAALLLLVLVALYGFLGGMKSAGVGGMLKMAIIWFSLFLAGFSAFQSVNTIPEAAVLLPDFPWYSLLGEGIGEALANLFSLIVGMICTQTYIQAIFSARDPHTASIGALVAALIVIPVGLPCVAIGMYMHAAHPDVSALLVLPVYLLKYQPVVIGSIAMGGILLSLISSIAGLSLGIGTIISHDLVPRFLPRLRGKESLLRTRLIVLSVVLLAAAVAIMNENSQVLFWNYMSMALRGGGIFLPLTLAIFRPHGVSPRCAFLSMIFSTSVAVAASFVGSTVPPLFLGLGISFLFLAVGYMTHHAPNGMAT